MPIAKIQLEDGRIARFEVPEGTTQDQVMQFVAANRAKFEPQKRTEETAIDQSVEQQPEPQQDLMGRRAEIIKQLQVVQPTGDMTRIQPLVDELTAIEEQTGGSIEGVLEPLATIGSAAIAEPVAGIAGLAQAINPFAEQGAGARAVEATREALTFKPRTQTGQAGLQAVGETLAPVGEALQATEKFLGDAAFKATGSPALAAAATTLPTAIIEGLGLGLSRKVTKGAKVAEKISGRKVRSMINEAAPEPAKLKEISRSIYNEIDDAGIRLKADQYSNLVKKVEKAAKSQGLSKRTTKQAAGAIDDMKDLLGNSPKITDIDDLRKVANGVAGNIDNTEKALGKRIVAEIDDFLDNLGGNSFIDDAGNPAAFDSVGKKYKAARSLWGRARKSELVTEAIENAKTRASGFENGMRIELGKLAKNKRTKKFFTSSEIKAINSIESGNIQQNIAKFLGRFAFNEGRANNVLSALSGVAGGSLVGGTVGAVAVPVIGQVARGVASKLTRGRADFLDSVIRAGNNAEDIAKAYIKAVPKKSRKVSELAELLTDPSVDLSKLESSGNIVSAAAEQAAGNRMLFDAATVAAPTIAKTGQEQE